MMIHEVTAETSPRKNRTRVGRGPGAGKGKTCGRGHKGCGSRAGGGVRPGYEGGQMPLFRRIPKRGFSNARFRKEYQVVNTGQLDARFDDGAAVDAEAMKNAGLVGDRDAPIKVLADGELSKKLVVTAHKFSKSAAAKIAAAGGEVKPVV